MILRYSRVFSFRYPRALRVYPRIEGNFFSTTRLAFSFFFISPSLYLSSFCVLPPPFQSGSPPVYFVSIQLTGAFPSRCTHSIRSPFFVIVFLSLIYLRFIFPLLLVSVRFFHIYIYIYMYVSGYRGANRIPVWQTRLIFSKNLCQKSSEVVVVIVELDCPSKMYIFFMEYVAN